MRAFYDILEHECPNYGPGAKCGLPSSYYWPALISGNVVAYNMSVYIVNILQTSKKSLIMISQKYSITDTIEDQHSTNISLCYL